MGKNAKGFTLIELLVVIAIIALLLSIVLPSLKKAKEYARTIICRSNMKQIGIAGHLYAQDNENFVPRGGVYDVWFIEFLPYIGAEYNQTNYKNLKILKCQSYPESEQTVTYVVNAWTFANAADMTGTQVNGPKKLDIFKSRYSKVYLADSEGGPWRPIIDDRTDPDIERFDVWKVSHLPDSNVEGNAGDTNALENGRRVGQKRHRDGSNYLFFDWHVDYVPTKDMNINYWRDK
jgi:prepilin-type N-terminal cleavage/methylation domain-containing protein/prepilin-type processing-associated H-X9-DG protein